MRRVLLVEVVEAAREAGLSGERRLPGRVDDTCRRRTFASFFQKPNVYAARIVGVMSYAALTFAFVMPVCSRPVAPSTFAGAPSLFCSAKPPVVPVGNVALVTYASGWLLLF